MAYIVRDPRFSMSMTPVECEPVRFSSPTPRGSYMKHLERRLINLWKSITHASRKQPRNSFMPNDFIAITSRRRSTLPPQMYRHYH